MMSVTPVLVPMAASVSYSGPPYLGRTLTLGVLILTRFLHRTEQAKQRSMWSITLSRMAMASMLEAPSNCPSRKLWTIRWPSSCFERTIAPVPQVCSR